MFLHDDTAVTAACDVLDIAQFDPSDEDGFYNAALIMDGGTELSRHEMARRFGIRDREHWRLIRESMYQVLAQQLGGVEEVARRELAWRSGGIPHHMKQQIARAAGTGGFAPVEGVSLEAWAAINAALVAGADTEDLLVGAGLDTLRWRRATNEWNARMAADTTFAIAQVYGNAFAQAGTSQYSAYAREARIARAEDRDLYCELPIGYEQYGQILLALEEAIAQGHDQCVVLRSFGLSIVDWTDLAVLMGYHLHRVHCAAQLDVG